MRAAPDSMAVPVEYLTHVHVSLVTKHALQHTSVSAAAHCLKLLDSYAS